MKRIKVGDDPIAAREHCEFLNKILVEKYHSWGPSAYPLPDLDIWMIKLDGVESVFGWTNTINSENDQVSEIYTGDLNTIKSTHEHGSFLINYSKTRAIFEIIENNKQRKYLFRGVFQYVTESVEYRRIWKKTTDFFDVQSQEKNIPADPNGEIYIIGALHAPKNEIYGVAKTEGVSADRIRFFDYDEAKRFDRDLISNTQVCVVFLGPTPQLSKTSLKSNIPH